MQCTMNLSFKNKNQQTVSTITNPSEFFGFYLNINNEKIWMAAEELASVILLHFWLFAISV